MVNQPITLSRKNDRLSIVCDGIPLFRVAGDREQQDAYVAQKQTEGYAIVWL
jgi:hypothetical protein